MDQPDAKPDKLPMIKAVKESAVTSPAVTTLGSIGAAQRTRPVAGPAKIRRRHFGLLLSFILMVLTPSGITTWYMETQAANQYASSVGFSVRKENSPPSVDFLGGLSGISSGGASDTDILYEYIQGQKLVELVDARLNLRQIFSKPKNDPIFTFSNPGSIEDLLAYWQRMVKIFYNASTGLIEIRVTAFDPHDAQNIARAIFQESSVMINNLSAIARADTTRYAKKDLDVAVARLKIARQAITKFRNKYQIVDPKADIQGKMGLLNILNQQLAEAMIGQDLLRETANSTDPRIQSAGRKIAVIKARIAAERKNFGATGGKDSSYSIIITKYEGLSVEREFAVRSYLSALGAFDTARAEAQRQSRYLAAYIEPTLAETALFPKRLSIIGLVTGFLFLIWSILALVAYSIKDRR